jgi:hypothetical protein
MIFSLRKLGDRLLLLNRTSKSAVPTTFVLVKARSSVIGEMVVCVVGELINLRMIGAR